MLRHWLLGYGSTCPSGYTSEGDDCFKNSSSVSAPDVPIRGLGNLRITGTAAAGGNDTVSFANGTQAYNLTALDSVLQMGTVWKQSEFNVIGDAGGSEAVFNPGAAVTVKVAAQYGSTAAPTCASNAGSAFLRSNGRIDPINSV
jgi:hypothetical protein